MSELVGCGTFYFLDFPLSQCANACVSGHLALVHVRLELSHDVLRALHGDRHPFEVGNLYLLLHLLAHHPGLVLDSLHASTHRVGAGDTAPGPGGGERRMGVHLMHGPMQRAEPVRRELNKVGLLLLLLVEVLELIICKQACHLKLTNVTGTESAGDQGSVITESTG